jgi:tetratricopeptide (TPR) repeat protein
LKPLKPRRKQSKARRSLAAKSKLTSLQSSPQISLGRKWLFRGLAAVVLPMVLLLTLELTLRLAGYGQPTGFFKSLRVGEENVLVENDSFGFRFFPPEVARLPRPIMIQAPKPPEVYRIFIFGESAAEGDPDPVCGPARFLEVLLRERFPQQSFEIVNVAMTAINSHAILPIARECAGQQGDLWIIYMGNNEMIGPFGAAGVFGGRVPPLAMVRANLAIQQTRLGQLLSAGARYFKSRKTSPSDWGGLEMFAAHHIQPDDPGKESVYRNFQGNLLDILRAGTDAGAKIILNTVAVNLKDCPPLASERSTTMTTTALADCERLSVQARTAEDQGDFAVAAKFLEQAVALDPHYAGLQYRWAECLLQMTNFAAARDHFQLACDCDAVPARTDSRINTLIREAAQQFTSPNLVMFDAAAALATNSVEGICGRDIFYEHVHFNPHGSYLLGRAWAEQMEILLPDAIRRKSAASWASQEICERRLALTDWNRRNDLIEIVNRRHAAPLNGQSNNTNELAALQLELDSLGKRMDAAGAAQARQIYDEAIQRAPKDMDIRSNFADFLEAIGSFSEAAEQWRQVQQLRPNYFLSYFQEGRMLERLGDLESAKTAFQRTIALRPGMASAWFELSNIAASQGDLDLALSQVEHAGKLQSLPVYYACMGKLLSRMNRHTDAVEHFRRALQVDSNYWDGHIALGKEFAAMRNWPDAQTEFEAAVRLRPDSASARINLGALLATEGELAAAQKEFEHVLQLEPGNQQARECLDQLRLAPPENSRLGTK